VMAGVNSEKETQMRLAKVVALAGALAVIGAASASAAPVIPNPGTEQASNIVPAAWGCGRGWHPNRWGHCVPNRYGYYRPYWSRQAQHHAQAIVARWNDIMTSSARAIEAST